MRRVCVPTVPAKDEVIDISGKESHHLTNVLRCQVTDTISLFDGDGNSNHCRILEIGKGLVRVQGLADIENSSHAIPRVLCIAQTKPKALDMAIRSSTEVGITHLFVFCASRSVNRSERIERWIRIATAAAKQCGRSDIPTIQWYSSMRQMLDMLPTSINQRFIAQPNATQLRCEVSPSAILVGPEGGFTDAEIELAMGVEFNPVGLADWTLRADTAAILAAGYICSRRN